MNNAADVLKGAASGFAERMENMLVFSVVLDLKNSEHAEWVRKYKEDGVPLDLVSLGMYVLTLYKESMLLYNRGLTRDDLVMLLRSTFRKFYNVDLSEEEGIEVARFFLSYFTNRGRQWTKSYFDFETGEVRTKSFHVLKDGGWDRESARPAVRLKLSDECQDMVFRTMEITKHLRMTIHLIFLEEQIARGVFDHALNTVMQISAGVAELRQQLGGLRDAIHRNVFDVMVRDDLRATREAIFQRMQSNARMMDDINALADETLKKVFFSDVSQEKQETLLRVKQMLARVIVEHSRVLSEERAVSMEYEDSSDLAMLELLLDNRFMHMQKDVYNVLVSHPDKPVVDAVEHVLLPYLPYADLKHAGYLQVFEPHLLRQESVSREDNDIIELSEEEEERLMLAEIEARVERADRLKEYLRHLMRHLYQEGRVRLSECDLLGDDVHPDLFFLITLLHQKKHVEVTLGEEFAVDSSTEEIGVPLEVMVSEIVHEEPYLLSLGAITIEGEDGREFHRCIDGEVYVVKDAVLDVASEAARGEVKEELAS